MAARKKPVEQVEPELEVNESMTESKKEVIDNTVKYRKDFDSWAEYHAYKGKKG